MLKLKARKAAQAAAAAAAAAKNAGIAQDGATAEQSPEETSAEEASSTVQTADGEATTSVEGEVDVQGAGGETAAAGKEEGEEWLREEEDDTFIMPFSDAISEAERRLESTVAELGLYCVHVGDAEATSADAEAEVEASGEEEASDSAAKKPYEYTFNDDQNCTDKEDETEAMEFYTMNTGNTNELLAISRHDPNLNPDRLYRQDFLWL